MPPSSQADTVHDVIVMGSGLAGSTLATILARQGLKVLMLGDTIRKAVEEALEQHGAGESGDRAAEARIRAKLEELREQKSRLQRRNKRRGKTKIL